MPKEAAAKDTDITSKSQTPLAQPEESISFFASSDFNKRESFLKKMDWSLFSNLVDQAGCREDKERIMALLCLT